MAQIKYVVFACLLLLTGFLAITTFQKLSATDFIKVQTQEEIDQSTHSGRRIIDGDVSSKGMELFKANCGSCHALDKVLSGPALRGLMTRGPWAEEKGNLKKWVRNPAAFIPTTQYTKELHKTYGQIMPSFSSSVLTDKELEEIFGYLTNGRG